MTAPTLAEVEPMLLGEVKQPFSDPAWTYELKVDGYRVMAGVERAGVRLKTRQGTDATRWFAEVTSGLANLAPAAGAGHILDGEVAVLDELGRSDFEALQTRARARGWRAGLPRVVYVAFDLLVHGGFDIRDQPLHRRKALLMELLNPVPPAVLYSIDMPGEGERLYRAALQLELEGIVAKRLESPYRSGERSLDWLKIKRPGAVPAERFKFNT